MTQFYNIIDERGRFRGLKLYHEGDGQHDTHTYSSAYYNAVCGLDFKTVRAIMTQDERIINSLEYTLTEDSWKHNLDAVKTGIKQPTTQYQDE